VDPATQVITRMAGNLFLVEIGAVTHVITTIAGGSITISGNLVMESIDLSSLATVEGSLTVTDNLALNAILISGLTNIGGDLTIIGTAVAPRRVPFW
jgi:hypothetical protein